MCNVFVKIYCLKGQSHEKFGEMSVWGISLGYYFLNFSDRPFNSCEF
jgi:hypothetical protein